MPPFVLDEAWYAWLSGPLAFAAMLVLTPLVIRLAHRQGWLAYPKVDRWHQRPTALMGGIALYAAATLALLVWCPEVVTGPVWIGATLMFATGFVDDLRDIRPAAKLVAQVVATGVLLYHGHLFGSAWPVWVSAPLTFVWMLGITNALNLLDNMDGLAAGIAALAALVLAVFSGLAGNGAGVGAAMAVAGAAAGFLVFNFTPARVFMGDCGSLFLGYAIAAFALVIQEQATLPGGVMLYLASVMVLAVPIFDTTLVTIVRTLSGRSVSQGGRDHSSHRLVLLGLSQRRTVLTLYGISASFGTLALVFCFADVRLSYALLTFTVLALVVFGIYLGQVDVYRPEEKDVARRALQLRRLLALPHALLGRRWKPAAGVVADVLVVVAAFIVAYHLRFEDGLTPQREAALLGALPFVVALKIPTFYAFRMYNTLWRCAGTPELVQVVKATAAASLLTYGVLAALHGAQNVAQGVFAIDWMITTLALLGVRFGFRGLRQYISAHSSTGRRVLLYGADEAGLLALRMLRQNPALGLNPVGFLDDDPARHGRLMQGVRVHGDLARLGAACRQHQIEEVLLAGERLSDERRRQIGEACANAHVGCCSFDLLLTPVALRSTFVQSMNSGDGHPYPQRKAS